MFMRYLLLLIFIFILSAVVVAQEAQECSALVEQALQAIDTNCIDMDRNSACYGFNRVDATFSEPVAENFFAQPSDRAGLRTMSSIQTAPLDTQLNQWGVALMSVQANIPNTLPGQAVTFILLGDVAVENQVDPDSAFLPVDPVPVTTLTQSNVRSFPTPNANVIISLAPGETLPADGLSADGEWVRVTYNNAPAWISRPLLKSDTPLSTLPTLSNQNRTPMQAFYFTTGVGEPNCNEPPDSLVIQGPGTTTVTFNANGTDFTIGSTVIFHQIDENTIQMLVVDGFAEVGGIIVPGGFTMFASLEEDGTIDPGSWTNFRAVTSDEIALYALLEQINVNEGDEFYYLNYPIQFPTPGEIAQKQAAIGGGGGGSSSTRDLAAASRANCDNLVLTSPLGAVQAGNKPYYWNPAEGATEYQIRFYNSGGGLVGSTSVSAPQTTVNFDAAAGVGVGQKFYWEVLALVNGTPACSSVSSLMDLLAPDAVVEDDDDGIQKPPFSAGWNCPIPYSAKITFYNADPDVGVTVYYTFDGYPYVDTFSGTDGTYTLSHTGFSLTGGRAESGSEVIFLPDIPSCM